MLTDDGTTAGDGGAILSFVSFVSFESVGTADTSGNSPRDSLSVDMEIFDLYQFVS